MDRLKSFVMSDMNFAIPEIVDLLLERLGTRVANRVSPTLSGRSYLGSDSCMRSSFMDGCGVHYHQRGLPARTLLQVLLEQGNDAADLAPLVSRLASTQHERQTLLQTLRLPQGADRPAKRLRRYSSPLPSLLPLQDLPAPSVGSPSTPLLALPDTPEPPIATYPAIEPHPSAFPPV